MRYYKMKETIRTFSTRDRANIFSIRKKNTKTNSIGIEAMGRKSWKPREGEQRAC